MINTHVKSRKKNLQAIGKKIMTSIKCVEAKYTKPNEYHTNLSYDNII